MRALVVYESLSGTTEAVARAVGAGLAEYMRVEVYDVARAPLPGTALVDLVVVGAPAHAFSLSSASARAEGRDQGAPNGQVGPRLCDWLAGLDDGWHAERFAAFDTRASWVPRLPGTAARRAIRIAHGHGYETVGCESFHVSATAGPLPGGELRRAGSWGARLASAAAIPTA